MICDLWLCVGLADEGLFIRNLLEENLGLKNKLSSIKPRDEKENVQPPLPPPPPAAGRVQFTSPSEQPAPRQIRSNPVNLSAAPLRPRSPGTGNSQCTSRPGPELPLSGGHRLPSARGPGISVNDPRPPQIRCISSLIPTGSPNLFLQISFKSLFFKNGRENLTTF